MSEQPKIAVVASSRADRGPLESVIAALPEATVIDAGFRTYGEPAKVMAACLGYFNTALAGYKLVILVGDRYETLAAALAATFLRVPIAHIHGGETTMGAFDNAMRHSITHLTRQGCGLHFCATFGATDMANNLVGEFECAYHVGAPGLDGIEQGSAKRDRRVILVTFHSETMTDDYGVASCDAMCAVLEKFDDYSIIFTGTNNDPGAKQIARTIAPHMKANWRIKTDYSRSEYIDAMQHAALIVGNSSSGVIEAPWVGIPSVNIGYRQAGREMAESVYRVGENCKDLEQMMRMAMVHNGSCGAVYKGGAAEKIAEKCREFVKCA